MVPDFANVGIKGTPFYSKVGSEGAYHIAEIPAGTYKLRVIVFSSGFLENSTQDVVEQVQID